MAQNPNQNDLITPELNKQFKKSFRWTLTGSIIYEIAKVAHIFALLKLVPGTTYGAIGSIFSLIYLTCYIADFGAYSSLPPFVNMTIQNKQSFRRFIFHYTILPHFPLIISCAFIATYLTACKLTLTTAMLIIIPSAIILETLRCFLRLLMHTTFHSRRTVLIDLTAFVLFLTSTWIPYLVFNRPITLTTVFLPHLIDSIFAVTVFIICIVHFYRKLPTTQTHTLPHDFTKRLISSRLFNYLLRVSRYLFSSNFLTPLFAIKFGLKSAGLFYFAGTFATSLQSILKSSIGYSGNALLANLKDSTQAAKKEAFNILWQKLIFFLSPIIIILAVNYQPIARLSQSANTTSYTLSLLLLYFLLPCTEFFAILYEQFYIVEEAASKLFLFKLLELAFVYLIITSPITASPAATLLGLIAVRILSFIIIAINAFYTWKITCSIKGHIIFLTSITVAAVIIRLILG
jgi:hypothetical protein